MRALIDRVVGGVAAGASTCFVVIVAIAAMEVVLRYAFDSPTIWVHELSVALAACAFLLGGPVVHQRRGHIAITFFLDRMPPSARRLVACLNSFLTLVFLTLLSWAAGAQALQALDSMETSGTATNWPTPVVLKGLLAVCALWMLLQTLVQFWRDARAVVRAP
jgi:TRAP-type C4-dicarboxylate transport system permease small subunit